MNISVRTADLHRDGELLLHLDQECFTRPYDWPSTKVEEEISFLQNSTVYLYFDGSLPIGFFAFAPKDKKVELKTICLIPLYQGKGIGKNMMEKFFSLNDGKNIVLVTHPENSQALKLYLHEGFVIKAWKDNYYGNGQPRLILEKSNSK